MFNRLKTIFNYPIPKQNFKRNIMSDCDLMEKCKAAAAQMAVKENITGDCIVGIGSGSTIAYVIKSIKELCEQKKYSVKCIPTSRQSKKLLDHYMLPITDLDRFPVIDIAIDGADEVDENFVAIKGGGACHAQEKVVASSAKKFVVVADYRKNSKFLGENWKKGIPIEVLRMAPSTVRYCLCRKYNVQPADIPLRMNNEANTPVITDNDNFILDWQFEPSNFANFTSSDWKSLEIELNDIPGVVEAGIFANMIHELYFGEPDGSVTKKTLKSSN